MKKSVQIALLMTLVCFLCTGCVKRYDREGIEEYVKRTLGLSNFLVSENYGVTKSGDYSDLVWTVYDAHNNVVFNVMDVESWGMETPVNRLENNYLAKLLEKYADTLPAYEDITVIPQCEHTYDECCLEFEYTDLEDLRKKCDEVATYTNALNELFPNYTLWIDATYSGTPVKRYKGTYTEARMDGADYCTRYDNTDITEDKVYERTKNKYFQFGYKYQFPEIMSVMTDEDKAYVFNESQTGRIIILRSGSEDDLKNAEKEVIPDLVAHDCIGIPIGNLYYLLQREGISVTGTAEDYTVRGVDGAEYHFSYDFVDPDSSEYDEEKRRYDAFYLKNDKRVYYGGDAFELRDELITKAFNIHTYCLSNCQIDAKKERNLW